MGRKVARTLARVAALVCIAIFLLALGIRLDQYLLRFRAERLLSDIRSLELRKSTYADVRRVIDHWSNETREGPCRREWCDVDISLGNFVWRHREFFVSHQRVLTIYRCLGGRAAFVRSSIRVRNDIVWEKSILVHVESSYEQNTDGGRFYLSLIANAETRSPDWVSPVHPEYRIGQPGGCTGCREGYVLFTPYADPNDVHRLLDINLTCVTRWQPCTEQADILPTAWKEVQAEKRYVEEKDHAPCTPAMIRVLSRAAQRVPLAIVIRVEHTGDGSAVTVRREGNANDLIFAYQPREYTFAEPASVVFRKGDLLLLLDDGCYAVKATEENLKAAQLGVSEDRSVQMNPVYLPSFGAIQPPRIDVR